MKVSRFFIISFLFFSSTQLSAQTADEIINKHITAIGGKDVINNVKSQIIESTLNVMGVDLNSVTTLQVGVGFKNVANFNGQEVIQVVTPTKGWQINPLAGITDAQVLPENELKEAQSSLSFAGELFDYKSKGHTIELIGKEKIDGADVYNIKLTRKNGSTVNYYIDAKTFYIIKEASTTKVDGEDLTTSTVYSNFKTTDTWYIMAYTFTVDQGFEMTVTINKVQFNVPVDPKIFEMTK